MLFNTKLFNCKDYFCRGYLDLILSVVNEQDYPFVKLTVVNTTYTYLQRRVHGKRRKVLDNKNFHI